MSDEVMIESTVAGDGRLKVSFRFERKVGLPDYSSATYSAWAEATVAQDADIRDYLSSLGDVAQAVKMSVLQEAGIEFAVGPDGIVRESVTPMVSKAQAEAVLKRTFPGAERVESDDDGDAPTVAVIGKQHGPLPSWLVQECQKRGVRKVYDNREDAVGTRKPHFKSAPDREHAFWPPKGA